MTAAEELRAAATLMRDRAEQAAKHSPGPWKAVAGEAGPLYWVATGDVYEWTIARTIPSAAPHIAGMHPGVAAAVADWLDGKVRNWDESVNPRDDRGWYWHDAPGGCGWPMKGEPGLRACSCFDKALAAARAYLAGEGQ